MVELKIGELYIEKKEGYRNSRCALCFKETWAKPLYYIRLPFANYRDGVWKLCKECFYKIFRDEIINQFEENE